MNGQYDVVIDQYVPEGVELSETLQEYLKTIIGLFRVKDDVRIIDVAKFLDKPRGTVYNGIIRMSEKGILATDHKGYITLIGTKI